MGPETKSSRNHPRRILWLALLVLLFLLALQYSEIQKALAPGKPDAAPAALAPRPTTIVFPRDSGSLRTKARFEVFLTRVNSCECHVEAALLGRALGKMDPDRLRVVYRDLNMPETQARLREMDVAAPCSGFAINGARQFTVPSSIPSDKGKRTVDLLSMDRNWTMEDIHAALGQEYESTYHVPFPVEKADFVTRVSAEIARGRSDLVVSETPSQP